MTDPSEHSPPAKRRGRETALDMIRSLGLVLLVVVPLWFLAQPGDGVEQRLRLVDQSGDVRAFSDAVPAAPVPAQLPQQWKPTVSQYLRSPVGLRLGWNTPSGSYAEYAATTGPSAAWLEEYVGPGLEPQDEVEIDGATWQRYSEEDGSVSFARTEGGTTVVVGTYRGTAPEAEVRLLASRLR